MTTIRPVPINEAESIFERFWDPPRSQLGRWKCDADPATGGTISQAWHAVYVKSLRGGGTVGRLRRDLRLATDGYDHFHICLSMPVSARLTVRVTAHGRQRTIIDRQRGKNTYVEYAGSLHGARLVQRIEIEITDESPEAGLCIILWLGLFHQTRRQAMRTRPSPFADGWDDLLLPSGKRVAAQPALNLFFDAKDLPALRRKVAMPPYLAMIDQFRKMARAHLADEPWRGIGPFLNPDGIRAGRSNGTPFIDPLAMRLCGFIGLLDDDPALLRMALKHALAAAHCQDWSADFLCNLPGHTFEHRAFNQYRVATNVVFAWDWAGAHLTKAGHAVLAEAVAMKGLPRMLVTLMQHPYVRSCNQGAYFAYGAIICQLALAKVWKRGGELLEPTVRALDQTIENYIAKDGGAFEGMGYVSSTVGHAVVAYQALARHRGVSFREVVPPKLAQSANYLTAMLSTAPPFGSAINVADGGRPGGTLYPDALGGLALLSKDRSMQMLLAGMISKRTAEREGHATPGSVFNVIFGPKKLPAPAARPPVFRILAQTGMLCSCRPTRHGLVRLQIIGAPAGAGHGHEDKGSFVIEAFGEEIVIDRGQMTYDDSRCLLIKFARHHNLLIPETAADPLPAQVNPCPGASLPQGRGDSRKLTAKIDATAAWGPLVKRWVRSITSQTPTEFLVADAMTLPATGAVSFHLHSRFPWRKTARGWISRGRRAEILVSPQWKTTEERGAEDFIDGRKEPVFHLTLRSGKAVQHLLKTRLSVFPRDKAVMAESNRKSKRRGGRKRGDGWRKSNPGRWRVSPQSK